MFQTKFFRAAIAMVAFLVFAPEAPQVSAVGCLDETGCIDCCPACGYTCELNAECKDEKIKGFDVESKVICIPRVVFPWQKRDACGCNSVSCNKCNHNGARLRRVCVLKEDSKTCPKCEYSWEVKKQSRKCVATKVPMPPAYQPVADAAPGVDKHEMVTDETTTYSTSDEFGAPYAPVVVGSTNMESPLIDQKAGEAVEFNAPAK